MKPFCKFLKYFLVAFTMIFIVSCTVHVYHHYPNGVETIGNTNNTNNTNVGQSQGNSTNAGLDQNRDKSLIMWANLHSFDILSVDPIYIDYKKTDPIKNSGQGGGMRKKIFEDFKIGDTDYELAGNNREYIIKKGFEGVFRRERKWQEETKMVYGESNFQQSFAGDIAVSIGMDKIGKAMNSFSFTRSTTKTSSYKNIYTFSRGTVLMYSVAVDAAIAKLDQGFVEAAKALPVPMQVPNGLNAAKADPTFSAYREFVAQWGTHFAQRIEYGGFKIAGMEMTEETYGEVLKQNYNARQQLEANIKGIEVGTDRGFGYGQSEGFKNITSNSKHFYHYKGGDGNPENWTVSPDNVQPIGVQLMRLHELFKPEIFKDGSNEETLAPQRAMLGYAITDYIGSAIDNNASLKEKKYRMGSFSLEMVKGSEAGSEGDIYGEIYVAVWEEGNPNRLRDVFIWDTRNVSEASATGPFFKQFPDKSIDFSLAPKNGGFDHAKNYKFSLYVELRDQDGPKNPWNNRGDDDKIGRAEAHFKLSDLSTASDFQVVPEPKEVLIHFENGNYDASDSGWEFKVRALVGEIYPGLETIQ
ncbi:MAG: MAC/perforin domain-containing protein [Saprospiraceae bacterium]